MQHPRGCYSEACEQEHPKGASLTPYFWQSVYKINRLHSRSHLKGFIIALKQQHCSWYIPNLLALWGMGRVCSYFTRKTAGSFVWFIFCILKRQRKQHGNTGNIEQMWWASCDQISGKWEMAQIPAMGIGHLPMNVIRNTWSSVGKACELTLFSSEPVQTLAQHGTRSAEEFDMTLGWFKPPWTTELQREQGSYDNFSRVCGGSTLFEPEYNTWIDPCLWWRLTRVWGGSTLLNIQEPQSSRG